jgi:uncharacterized repeat protein (TIGR01451 family)
MQFLKRTVFVFALALLFTAKLASVVVAQSYYGQYGGNENPGQIMVDKLVRDPATGNYVDNLGLQNYKYYADNTVFFSIEVQNTGGTTLTQTTVIDTLPVYVQYVGGGNYDTKNRQVKWTLNNLLPSEKRTLSLQVKVNSYSDLPSEKTVLCPVNVVYVEALAGGTDTDRTQFCIEKKIMVSKEVPKAGAPLGLLMGLGSLTTLIGGFKLKRKYS